MAGPFGMGALKAAFYPEGGYDAEARRALEDEARAGNARIVRWIPWLVAPLNGLSVVVIARRPAGGPADATWLFWVVGFNALLTVLWVLAGVVAWSGRPAVVWRGLGGVVGALVLLGGAARSANAQRAHPNINMFIAAAFATAFFLRMRPRAFVPALLLSTALVLGAIAAFREEGAGRFADTLALLGTSAVALAGFFVARAMRARELAARRRAELLNAELERRVEAQDRDIAERMRVEEALRRARVEADAANRAKSAFLANMSHEIRTPMNAVLGYAQLLEQDPALTREQRERLDVIRKSGGHLLDLINDVLEMSKIEAGARELDRDAVDLRRLLDELERTFRPAAEEKRLSFAIHEGPGVPRRLAGDEGRLRRVLMNLIDNAVKFTERGEVRIRVLVEQGKGGAGERLAVEVEDSGAGIEPAELGALFRPFAQLRTGIDAKGGTGLGLALSRAYARLMGGDVRVDSRVGEGSTFRLEIPLTADNDAEPAGDAARAGSVPASLPPRPAAVLEEHAPALPAALAEQISQALHVADYEGLLALAARFPTERAPAAEAFRTLVEQYRYDEIAAALRR